MNSTIKMKTILISLLSGILVLSLILIRNAAAGAAKKPDASASASSASTAAATVTPYATEQPILKSAVQAGSYAPITVDNVTGFQTGWSGAATDGVVNGVDAYDSKVLTIPSGGTSPDSVQVYRDGIPFENGAQCTFYFSASSDPARSITVRFVNSDTGAVLASQSYTLSPATASYTLNLTMQEATTWNGRIVFALGSDGSAASTDYNTVTLSSMRMISSKNVIGVRTNQVGYLLNEEKRCTFSYNAGDVFDVVDSASGTIVYSGAIVNETADTNTGENEYYGDFTNVTTPGTYYIRSQIGIVSHAFTIAENPYPDLQKSLLKMLSLQRCGQDLNSSWAGSLAHPQCHTDTAAVYGTSQTIDVSGGWHDAGDYGRYIKTGSKAVNDLLFAYMFQPNQYGDDGSGPDAGNGVSDLLDEARYELEWMLKMQADSGGVYNKVLTSNLAEIISPDQDKQALYVLPEETTATADFAGTMAAASLAYQKSDPDFANQCLQAAEAASAYLDANPDIIDVKNPADINGGEYLDSKDGDGRFYADIALWAATQDSQYLDKAKALYQNDNTVADGVSWSTNGGYGKYLFLMMSNAQSADSDFYNAMKDSLKKEADGILSIESGNSYNSSLFDYSWGSNGSIAENGIVLSMQYDVSGDQQYRQAAVEQVNYLLGRNSLDLCFVSGYGSLSPQNVHSRVAKALNTSLSGALVGGPNSSREDTVTAAMGANVPNAKVYSDSFDSYSTNEISIYWNSALIHLLSKLQ